VCSAPRAVLPQSPQLCQNGGPSVLASIGKQIGREGGRHHVFWAKISWWKRSVRTVHCRDAAASSFAAKVRGEVFAHFYIVAIGYHSSMRNWLFGLSWRILCEQSPWCQRKWWVCSWLYSSPVLPFLVSVRLTFRVRLMLSSPIACLIIYRVLSSTIVSRPYNSCTDGSTSPRDYVSGQ
jgi:hypothetical protein